ncbi:cobalt ECF transporter T component CbiQ [Tissierella creatinini]|nr:cobalt ECF transporter T component CbiQ [Tissierella creatinini]TJX65611.1 cobalt ECF transporter T component CbiQ [Soehngenia saccharolytica]
MLIIDKYAYTNKLADSNPFNKFIIVVISLGITTIINNIYINLMIFAFMIFLTTIAAGIPFDKYIKILSIPMSFLIISIITILISISKTDIFLWEINVFDYFVGITRVSVDESILLLTRVLASITSTFFLGLTTPLNNLIRVFKRLHLPNSIIELIVLIYRFIFIFLGEARDIYLTQEMKFGYTDFKNSLKSTALLVRSLFLKILLDYKDMVIVLECKLYDGEFRIGD